MPSTISPATPVSCSHCLRPYFYLLLFIAALLSFSFMIYDRAALPLLPLTPNQMPWLDQLLCPRTGEDYLQYGVTHQCLLSAHNK